MRILGIDIGSRAVKLVLFNNDMPEFEKVLDTAGFYRDYCHSSEGKIIVNFDLLDLGKIDRVVSTGYGRNNVNIEGAKVIIELKAHVLGAVWQTGLENFTLLDIGGQDSKVISVKSRKTVDMILNDKCAASCGRYLENMAAVLDIALPEMEKHFDNPVDLNSTCAVFAETELIGRISEGYSMERLAAGVNYSLFKRIKPLIEKFPDNILVMSGGVAKNKAIVHFIKSELRFKEVIVLPKPQLNGAIGCCAYGLKQMAE